MIEIKKNSDYTFSFTYNNSTLKDSFIKIEPINETSNFYCLWSAKDSFHLFNKKKNKFAFNINVYADSIQFVKIEFYSKETNSFVAYRKDNNHAYLFFEDGTYKTNCFSYIGNEFNAVRPVKGLNNRWVYYNVKSNNLLCDIKKGLQLKEEEELVSMFTSDYSFIYNSNGYYRILFYNKKKFHTYKIPDRIEYFERIDSNKIIGKIFNKDAYVMYKNFDFINPIGYYSSKPMYIENSKVIVAKKIDEYVLVVKGREIYNYEWQNDNFVIYYDYVLNKQTNGTYKIYKLKNGHSICTPWNNIRIDTDKDHLIVDYLKEKNVIINKADIDKVEHLFLKKYESSSHLQNHQQNKQEHHYNTHIEKGEILQEEVCVTEPAEEKEALQEEVRVTEPAEKKEILKKEVRVTKPAKTVQFDQKDKHTIIIEELEEIRTCNKNQPVKPLPIEEKFVFSFGGIKYSLKLNSKWKNDNAFRKGNFLYKRDSLAILLENSSSITVINGVSYYKIKGQGMDTRFNQDFNLVNSNIRDNSIPIILFKKDSKENIRFIDCVTCESYCYAIEKNFNNTRRKVILFNLRSIFSPLIDYTDTTTYNLLENVQEKETRSLNNTQTNYEQKESNYITKKLNSEQIINAQLIYNAQKCQEGIIYKSPSSDKFALITKRDTIIKPGKVRYNFNEYDKTGMFIRSKEVCSTSNFRKIMGYVGFPTGNIQLHYNAPTPDALQKYIEQFSTLHVNKMRGKKAPHKAILLLCIIDLIENHFILTNKIEYSDILENRFISKWKQYVGESAVYTNPKAATPYWHMHSEPYWKLVPFVGGEETIANLQKSNPYSSGIIRKNIRHAEIDKELFELLQEESSRNKLKEVLIQSIVTN